MPSTSTLLYYFSSFIHLAILPKHVKVGATLIRKTIAKVPHTEPFLLAKAIIPPTWDYVNGLLVIMSLMNFKWAQNGGPDGGIDDAILSVSALAGLYVGVQYYRARLYIALVVLWLAPTLSILARVLS
ncbi:hypothetical protein BO94DRAFT_532956 [Aspergillus sclerotioniger CBS 115572]|uniref:Uncharacterized protein n=1 Tax=Aspergillus sclerotioniger CBS 115572 TaxID=1450535 RepID=A0A317X6G0_9EURO|nr:hypothetical protein BO94DRAFT_532956 [Aspergillus sclerotioniger CBS 115572]PWY93222.1 hypothetical protein BO94DRAFT_532956 [Aspergillus sclerotioniger CBS 115572]